MADVQELAIQPSAITEAAIPSGRRPYLLAQVALIDMRIAKKDSPVGYTLSATKEAIDAIAEADANDDFQPPLTPELSFAVSKMRNYGNSEGAYKNAESSLRDSLDHTALREAALLVAAVVHHGLGQEESQV